MALSQTDILNKALTLVGASPITNITDDSNNARTLSRVYETSLRYVLSECKWNFATKRATLSAITNTLDFDDIGEDNVYQKPTDMIRIFSVNPPSSLWREEGDNIISDSSSLGVRYVYFLNTPSKYPMYFIEALVDKLAADICFAILNSAPLAEKFIDKYEKISLPKATSANSQTGIQQRVKDDAWEMAKYQDTQPDA